MGGLCVGDSREPLERQYYEGVSETVPLLKMLTIYVLAQNCFLMLVFTFETFKILLIYVKIDHFGVCSSVTFNACVCITTIRVRIQNGSIISKKLPHAIFIVKPFPNCYQVTTDNNSLSIQFLPFANII